MTLPSTHHSPTTVNKNASELTIGTVKLSSVPSHRQPQFAFPYQEPRQ
jgi:hypothetical protein